MRESKVFTNLELFEIIGKQYFLVTKKHQGCIRGRFKLSS